MAIEPSTNVPARGPHHLAIDGQPKPVPPMQHQNREGRGDVLILEDLSFVYGGTKNQVRALDAVVLTVLEGEWVAVMGPSGSGKSTLLLCAAALRRPGAGKVVLAGEDVSTLSDRRLTKLRRDRTGFVFQEFNLVPALTAGENVALPARLGGVRPSRADVLSALEQVGLRAQVDRRPEEMSGGERQRVAVARALMVKPRILFADEPTGSLDVRSRDQVLDLFQGLIRGGTGILMVTHDPAVAARADRVLWLRDGRLISTMSRSSAQEIALRLAAFEAEAL